MTSLHGRTSWLLLMLTLACEPVALEHDGPPADIPTPSVLQQAATVPSGFFDELVVSGIASPTSFAFAPDGRLFVTQQDGRLRVVRDGTLLSEPFATFSVSSLGERGLLGVAFDPDFASNGYLYVYYTAREPTVHNRISRLQAAGDVAAPGSETVLFELDSVDGCTVHMGGALHIGPDGELFAGVGDHCNADSAQRLDRLSGKMLRIRTDGSIPEDNPFYGSTSGRYRAIWAEGLRNPFSFAISRSGQMLINDVGLNDWEEINEGRAGANYGWPESEGPTSRPGHTGPVFAYRHTSGSPTGCSIIGAAFYEPSTSRYPSAYDGTYFFGDYCEGFVRTLDPTRFESDTFLGDTDGLVALTVGPDGFLYRLERGDGSVARVRYEAAQAPVITSSPEDRVATVGESVTFSVRASGSEPLRYQWQKNGADIAGATSRSHTFTVASADDGALFRVVVTNASGSVTSAEATLTVTQNSAPTATITAPSAGAQYSAGDEIMYAGTAEDAEDGMLPASAFTWEVVLHHDTHTHPFLAPFTGQRSGSFVVPRTGHTETNVFYRIHLRVRDSSGGESETFRDVTPRLSTITLRTDPPGLALTVDGAPVTTPATVRSVVGMTRTLGVVSPQDVDGTSYRFSGWSDGGAAAHAIETPSSDTTYVASFAAECAQQALRPVDAVASSTVLPWLSPQQAIDGNLSTRWSSAFSDPQWLYVDLGAEQRIERVVLHWARTHARDYELQVSDSPLGSWETIATRSGFAGGTDSFDELSASGRYLRVYASERATAWSNSLWELELFGAPAAGCESGSPVCGNGVVESDEQCDDGNASDGDGCSAICRPEASACMEEPLPRTGAVASSVENSRLPAAAAIDGDPATRWSSAFRDPQWISVDLGASRLISRVVLDWEVAHAEDYRLEVAESPSGPWTAVATRTGFLGGTDVIAGLSAVGRYVRVYASARGTRWGNSLWELQLFGDPDPDCER